MTRKQKRFLVLIAAFWLANFIIILILANLNLDLLVAYGTFLGLCGIALALWLLWHLIHQPPFHQTN